MNNELKLNFLPSLFCVFSLLVLTIFLFVHSSLFFATLIYHANVNIFCRPCNFSLIVFIYAFVSGYDDIHENNYTRVHGEKFYKIYAFLSVDRLVGRSVCLSVLQQLYSIRFRLSYCLCHIFSLCNILLAHLFLFLFFVALRMNKVKYSNVKREIQTEKERQREWENKRNTVVSSSNHQIRIIFKYVYKIWHNNVEKTKWARHKNGREIINELLHDSIAFSYYFIFLFTLHLLLWSFVCVCVLLFCIVSNNLLTSHICLCTAEHTTLNYVH